MDESNWTPENIIRVARRHKSPTYLSDDDRKDIRMMHKNGFSQTEISKVKAITPSAVHRTLHENRVSQKKPPLSAEEIGNAIGLRESGTTWTEIGARYGRDAGTICNAVKRFIAKQDRNLS